jgi:hypothetical protein
MPLTSSPAKLSVTTQCVVRTAAECRGACGRSDSRAASPRKSADSAMASVADDSTRLGHRQGDGTASVSLHLENPATSDIRLATLPGKRYSHRSAERDTLDV